MAINRSSLSSQSLKQNTDVTLELLVTRPVENVYLDTPVTPNRMVGYYNYSLNRVELFVTDATGYRYIKVN